HSPRIGGQLICHGNGRLWPRSAGSSEYQEKPRPSSALDELLLHLALEVAPAGSPGVELKNCVLAHLPDVLRRADSRSQVPVPERRLAALLGVQCHSPWAWFHRRLGELFSHQSDAP